MSDEIVKGSIADISKQQNQSIAMSFLDVEAIVIVDVSGSMSSNDSREGRKRYDVALSELRNLQAELPGKIGVVGFSSNVAFYPGGQPDFMGEATDLARALSFAKQFDMPDMRFFVISDGEPDEEHSALAVAKTFQGRIDAIFVGSDYEPSGKDFLEKLARQNGGQSLTATCADQLTAQTMKLLTA